MKIPREILMALLGMGEVFLMNFPNNGGCLQRVRLMLEMEYLFLRAVNDDKTSTLFPFRITIFLSIISFNILIIPQSYSEISLRRNSRDNSSHFLG